MAKKTKPLLNEGTVRRMMKLANMDALGDGFISEKYTPLEEETVELEERGSKEGEYKRRKGKRAGDVDHHYKAYEKNENLDEQDEFEAEEEVADVGDDEEVVDMEADVEVEDETEGEVTITDEEAQDIIDLADKLKDAVGEGGEEEEFEAEEEEIEEPGGEEEGFEEEVGLEEPGVRYESKDELYEAALKGLDITLVDDQKARKAAAIKEVKNRIYQRVVNRLLKESK